MGNHAADDRIKQALDVAFHNGGIDGAHHKQWVIDQMVRALTGKSYEHWVSDWEMMGNEWQDWEEGIAP